MNSERFASAKKCYEKGDYTEALKNYYACLKEDSASFAPGDAGLVYHMLGNCLVKMKRFPDAIDVFEKAFQDTAYDRKGAVHANLGIACIGCGRYEDAVASFSLAIADPSYTTPYRAYSGLGNANMKLGKYSDAGMAYRNAALDEHNPDPVKALVNLGTCFMKLDRPGDAVATLTTALDFDAKPAEIASVYETMGSAYQAMGDAANAVASFEKAIADGSHTLSDEAAEDYAAAQAVLAGDALPVLVSDVPEDDLFAGLDNAPDDTYADQAWNGGYQQTTAFDRQDPYGQGQDSYDDQGVYAQGIQGYDGYDDNPYGRTQADGNSDFFSTSDDDIERMGKEQQRQQRQKRHIGLKVLLVIVILIVLALGAAFYAYWVGYGYPTQESTIESLFTANATGDDVTQYWASTDTDAIKRAMDSVAPTDTVSIDSVERSTVKSTAIVTATLSDGGTVRYQVDMTRGGGLFGIDALAIGWKVSSIDFAFASTQNGSTAASAVGTVSNTTGSSSKTPSSATTTTDTTATGDAASTGSTE